MELPLEAENFEVSLWGVRATTDAAIQRTAAETGTPLQAIRGDRTQHLAAALQIIADLESGAAIDRRKE